MNEKSATERSKSLGELPSTTPTEEERSDSDRSAGDRKLSHQSSVQYEDEMQHQCSCDDCLLGLSDDFVLTRRVPLVGEDVSPNK